MFYKKSAQVKTSNYSMNVKMKLKINTCKNCYTVFHPFWDFQAIRC